MELLQSIELLKAAKTGDWLVARQVICKLKKSGTAVS